MRFARLAAFAIWLVVALLAVAGFAAFSPEETPSSTTAPPTANSALSTWGSTSGRVVAFAFSSGLRSQPDLQVGEDALLEEMLTLRARLTASTRERPRTTTSTPTSTVPTTTPTSTVPTTTPTSTVPTTTTTTTTVAEVVLPTPTTTTTEPSPTDTTAPTTTTSVPPTGRLSEQEARAIVALFFTAEDVERALRVAYCESRWDPGATNPRSGAAGLFQQIPRYWADRSAAAGWAGADIYDAHANTAVSAWLVYEGGGWGHWAASQWCWT